MKNNKDSIQFSINGMKCNGCLDKIQKGIGENFKDVRYLEVSSDSLYKELFIRGEDLYKIDILKIKEEIEKLGFKIKSFKKI